MHPETVRISSVPSRPDSNILLLALEATGDGIWYWDVGSDETFFSPSYYRMLGYEPNAFPMTGQSWLNRIHPEDRHRVLEENTRCINNPEKTLQVEYRMLKKDGGYAWILCRGRCIDSDETGKAVNVIGTTTNISDRKQMEHELLESIETVRTVIEESPFSLVDDIDLDDVAGTWRLPHADSVARPSPGGQRAAGAAVVSTLGSRLLTTPPDA